MIFASFFIFDSTVSQKMDHFDISFACSIFSKSWEVTNYGFLDVAHLPLSRETFVEFKTLASLAMTPNARAQQVQSDTEKRAHDLDLKYPGSTFTQVLKSHGKDGRYLVLVVGPFANFSDDFVVLSDFLGRARALKAIHS
jgi:hypothetical protein